MDVNKNQSDFMTETEIPESDSWFILIKTLTLTLIVSLQLSDVYLNKFTEN